jgi:predicted nucleotidyltransferase component of viral defense system
MCVVFLQQTATSKYVSQCSFTTGADNYHTKTIKSKQVSKQAAQKCDVERFNLRKLSELDVRKQYQIEITKQFAGLETLNDNKVINRAWENIKENIKTSATEFPGLY